MRHAMRALWISATVLTCCGAPARSQVPSEERSDAPSCSDVLEGVRAARLALRSLDVSYRSVTRTGDAVTREAERRHRMLGVAERVDGSATILSQDRNGTITPSEPSWGWIWSGEEFWRWSSLSTDASNRHSRMPGDAYHSPESLLANWLHFHGWKLADLLEQAVMPEVSWGPSFDGEPTVRVTGLRPFPGDPSVIQDAFEFHLVPSRSWLPVRSGFFHSLEQGKETREATRSQHPEQAIPPFDEEAEREARKSLTIDGQDYLLSSAVEVVEVIEADGLWIPGKVQVSWPDPRGDGPVVTLEVDPHSVHVNVELAPETFEQNR